MAFRVVVDAIAYYCTQRFWTELLDAGAEVRVFSPIRQFMRKRDRFNFRTHRKIVIVDGYTVFTGGLNISANNITNVETGRPPWRNTHIRIQGDTAFDMQDIFSESWLYSTPISSKGVRRTRRRGLRNQQEAAVEVSKISISLKSTQSNTGPWVQLVSSGPDEPAHDIPRLFFSAINGARERLWITTPYFVPDDAIQMALTSAAAKGVDVRIIIPANSDMKLVDAAARTYARDAVQQGVNFWFYTSAMNHSKTIVVDNDVSIVGTANFDNRSFRLNFEVAAVIFDQAFAAQLAKQFEIDLLQSEPFPLKEQIGIGQQLVENASRLLSPVL